MREAMHGVRRTAVALVFVFVTLFGSSTSSSADGMTLESRFQDGHCKALAISNGYLYAQRGNSVEVWEVQESPALTLVFKASIPAAASLVQLLVDGTILYIIEKTGFVQLVDVGTPTTPRLLSTISAPHAVTAGAAGNGELFLVGGTVLSKYDVGDPTNPSSDGTFSPVGNDVALNGTAVYSTVSSAGASLLWVIDAASMVLSTSLLFEDFPLIQLEMAGATLVTAGVNTVTYAGGYVLFDVSDPLLPAPADTISGAPTLNGTAERPWLAATGSYAYSFYQALSSRDLVTYTSQIIPSGTLDVLRFDAIWTSPDYLLTTTRHGGHGLFDLGNPAEPTLELSADHGGTSYGVDVANGQVFMAQSAGLRILDVSTSGVPTVLGEAAVFGEVKSVALDGDRAYCMKTDYISSVDSVAVFDVSDPTNPSSIGLVGTGTGNILSEADTLYVFDGMGSVWDLTNPTSPLQIATANPPNFQGATADLQLHDDNLYIADSVNGLVIFGATPEAGALPLRSEYTVTSGVLALAVQGEHLLVGSGGGDLLVVSITDPSNPSLVASVPTPSPLTSIAWTRDYAYAVDSALGLHTFLLRDPSNPVLLESVALSDTASGIEAWNERVYVSEREGGLSVWRPAEGIPWENLGPGGGGAFFAAATHPKNTDIVFAGGDLGGIFRSLDGGASWETLNDSLTSPFSQSRGHIGLDFVFPEADTTGTLVYAATGDGIFRSPDLGETFTQVYPSPPHLQGTWLIGELFAHPSDTDVQYASLGVPEGNGGLGAGSKAYTYVLATDDDWVTSRQEQLDSAGVTVHALVYSFVHTNNDKVLAASDKGLFVRNPSTQEWDFQLVSTLPIPPDGAVGMREMVYDSVDEVLYAVVESCADCVPADPEWVHGGVYKSLDDGASWTPANGPTALTNDLPNSGFEDPPATPPTKWSYSTAASNSSNVTLDSDARSGLYSLLLDTSGFTEATDIGIIADPVPLQERQVVTVNFFAKFVDMVPSDGSPLEWGAGIQWGSSFGTLLIIDALTASAN